VVVTTQAFPGGDDEVTRQRQARALGDPTHHRIYRRVTTADEPVTVAELTAEVGLNHNAIPQHLAVLREAGLVVEDLAPAAGPGRRRLRYRTSPAAAAAWGGDDPYERLSLLLVEALRSGRSPHDAGQRLAAGRRADRSDPLAALVDATARPGFEPRLVEDGGRAEIVLGRYPFAAAEEMADGLDAGVAVTGPVARNPNRAGCRVRIAFPQGAPCHV
jgi:predicted ArsR family transcriptional regulator